MKSSGIPQYNPQKLKKGDLKYLYEQVSQALYTIFFLYSIKKISANKAYCSWENAVLQLCTEAAKLNELS